MRRALLALPSVTFLLVVALLNIALLATQLTAGGVADLQITVQRLTRQLGSAQLDQRSAAEEQLVALGPEALDFLPTFAGGAAASDAQKHDAVARVRQRLERQISQRAAATSTVTLSADNRPVSEVLAEITRQTGNKFSDLRTRMGQVSSDPPISVHFDKTPFWQAVDKTLDLAQLSVYSFAASDSVGIVAQSPSVFARSGRAAYCGPLRIEATKIAATRALDRSAQATSTQVTLEIAWEPRLRPIVLTQPLADIKATDERGQAILVAGASATAQLERPVDAAGIATEFQIPLVGPSRDAKAIASLGGKLSAILPGKIETFEFADLQGAKRAEQHKAGVTVTLDEMTRAGDAWQARLRIHYDKAGKALDTFRGWIFKNEVYMVDRDGKRIEHADLDTTRQTDDELGVAYRFDLRDSPAGMKLIYKTPGLLESVPLEYRLKDLPLP